MTEEAVRGAPDKDPRPDRNPEAGVQPREKWNNKMEFIFSMAGEIIGLGNVWRFPYLCFKNGGGVFLIPYFVFLFLCGIPVFFLETALGQYTSEGGVTAWRKICPMFQGVGIASQVIVVYLNIYYIVVLAWAIFYLFNAFRNPLPWSTCDNVWNSELCHDRLSIFANPHLFQPDSNWSFLNNITSDYYDNTTDLSIPDIFLGKSSEEEFWIVATRGIFITIVVYYLSHFQRNSEALRLKYSQQEVVYFTATFPYVILFILFIRGVTLPGAAEGLKYYLYPNFSKIAEPDVWNDAGTQVFFSYAVCQGVLTALGSYNKYNNNCYRDCLALCCLNSATSIFAGFVVFSVLGFMAHELDIPIDEVASSGPGLAFIAYPKALSMLPGSSFWAVLFFLMVLFLGLDSQFVCVESLATAITDMFPRYLRRPRGREILVLVIAVVCFLLGLSLVTESHSIRKDFIFNRGGILLFQLIDTYGPSGTSLLIIACLETVAIGWVYGPLFSSSLWQLKVNSFLISSSSSSTSAPCLLTTVKSPMCLRVSSHLTDRPSVRDFAGADRFYDNIEDMIGYPPFPMLKYCWLFITPLICVITVLYNLANIHPVSVYGYTPGTWGSSVGTLLVFTPLVCIPVFVMVALFKNPNNMTTPSSDLRQVRPHKPILTLCGHAIFKAQAPPNRNVDERNEKLMMEESNRV
ncbi:hypothetical protein L3Q82_000546 [Scortum barcoo]|uniref:Uncharacterized protein n=1 Tax=Scortum barcoo TaxID=214431 RepID=A0ACB8WG01_9TELE|nr:hypothetical protein L3Q82_000546 [Scortum barcoo]